MLACLVGLGCDAGHGFVEGGVGGAVGLGEGFCGLGWGGVGGFFLGVPGELFDGDFDFGEHGG